MKQPSKIGSALGQERDVISSRLLSATIQKLGINKKDLATAPRIGEILDYAKGGSDEAIRAIRFSDNETCRAFLKVYDKASITDRRILPIEAFALLAEVDIPELLGQMILALGQHSANIIKVMLPSHHPDTVKARIEYAKTPEGYRDRDAIDKAMRLLPTPKGMTFIFGDNTVRAESDDDMINPEDIQEAEIFPRITDTQKLLED